MRLQIAINAFVRLRWHGSDILGSAFPYTITSPYPKSSSLTGTGTRSENSEYFVPQEIFLAGTLLGLINPTDRMGGGEGRPKLQAVCSRIAVAAVSADG